MTVQACTHIFLVGPRFKLKSAFNDPSFFLHFQRQKLSLFLLLTKVRDFHAKSWKEEWEFRCRGLVHSKCISGALMDSISQRQCGRRHR